MFPRIKTFPNKDGSTRKYLYIVENRKISGRTKQVITANLGRLHNADVQINELIDKFSKLTTKVKIVDIYKDMVCGWTKEYGTAIVMRRVWQDLGIEGILNKYASNKKTEFNLPEAIFAMVVNRLMEPASKLKTHKWIEQVYGIEKIELHQFYRALDFLIENKNKIEEDIFFNTRDLFNSQLDMVLMDTTSITYWGDGENAEDILDYGYSKEKRFDLKQVVVGVLMTKQGLPVGHEVYKGNTNDVKAFRDMIKSAKERFNIRRVVIVCDRGMVCKENLQLLENEGYEYIVGVKMRQVSKDYAKKLLDKKEMKKLTINLYGKEQKIDGRRLVVCYNSDQAQRDKLKRKEIIARLKDKLKSQGLKSILVNKEYSKYLKIEAEKPVIDKEKVEKQKLYDGKYVLQTNTKLSWKETVVAYKDLWQIERGFRSLKSEMEVGPLYHWTESRIRSHIFVCFLALLLKYIFSKKIKELNENLNITEVLEHLKKIKVVKIKLDEISYIIRTELTGSAHFAFKAAKLKIPDRIISTSSKTTQKVMLRA